jgi:hypothetical protein
MRTTVKVRHKGQGVIPASVGRQAAPRKGDRSTTCGDDEYTPEQRRLIDARLAEARKGPYYGPFDTVEEMAAHMKARLKKRAAAQRTEPTRSR